MADIDLIATILAEAGPTVGLGHLTRCAAVYDALESVGVRCQLIVAGEAPSHVVGMRRVRLCEWRTPESAVEFAATADIAVVDSYIADTGTYRAVAEHAGVAVYFDDTARMTYPPGVVVNGNPEAEQLAPGHDRLQQLLLGTAYQVLRREFWSVEPHAIRPDVRQVLVVSGGTDAAGVRDKLVAAACVAYPEASIDAVVAPRTAAEMADAMRASDIAITAAGQTLYELAVMGVPTVGVCIADNQVPQAAAFERARALQRVDARDNPNAMREVTALLREMSDASVRSALSSAGQRLIDGKGAIRVARRCVRAALDARVDVRLATAMDEADLLDLANDPAVRGMSFSTSLIALSEHRLWLQRTLSDSSVLLFVATDDNRLVGQVRFNLSGIRATVSISISQPYRGFGLAGNLLERAVELLRDSHPEITTLVARVKAENQSSRRLFELAGFLPVRPPLGASEDTITYERPTEEQAR